MEPDAPAEARNDQGKSRAADVRRADEDRGSEPYDYTLRAGTQGFARCRSGGQP